MSDATEPTPLVHRFEDDGVIPNSALPLLLYPAALELLGEDPARAFEERFAQHGWARSWRNGIFAFPHYHSTAHEVLGIARGQAEVRLGGQRGLVRTLQPGDVVVIPAGVGHQNLGSSGDFLVVGAYPVPGPDWDLCTGEAGKRPQVLRNIEQVPRPGTDPLHGEHGPLLTNWR